MTTVAQWDLQFKYDGIMQILLTIPIKKHPLCYNSPKWYIMTVISDAQLCAACLQLSATAVFFCATCTSAVHLILMLVCCDNRQFTLWHWSYSTSHFHPFLFESNERYCLF